MALDSNFALAHLQVEDSISSRLLGMNFAFENELQSAMRVHQIHDCSICENYNFGVNISAHMEPTMVMTDKPSGVSHM